MIDLQRAMQALAKRRPIFHSEADFQQELAWEIRQIYPDAAIRLERPLANGTRGAIDIVITNGGHQHALELKYLKKSYQGVVEGESFTLNAHNAPDNARYDVCRDIARMEDFSRTSGKPSAVLVLTNDPQFWNTAKGHGACDEAFRIGEGQGLSGDLEWAAHAGPARLKSRAMTISLSGEYTLAWTNYSLLEGASGQFRYLLVDVGGVETAMEQADAA